MRKVYDENLKDYIYYADKSIISVREVRALPDYKLLLTFSNNEQRIYNAAHLLNYEIFAPLKPQNFFMLAKSNGSTVCWNDDLDIAPEELYMNSVPVVE